MVATHEILVQGVSLTGTTQLRPALLQMNSEDFPARFLTDLGAMSLTPGSTVTTMATSAASAVTLYQPVQRVLHVALLQLACESVSFPRLDPTRVESAGVVIRRVVRKQGVDDLSAPPSAWLKSADGQFQWTAMSSADECQDPDPTRRPQLQSGQPGLDALLAQQSLSIAKSEVFTPAFVAAPDVCEKAGRTFVYAVLPTASPDVTTNAPAAPQYDVTQLNSGLPTLLQGGSHSAPYADQTVNYRYMSDDYARANGATSFLTFSTTLRMLYTVFGAFQNTAEAKAVIEALNKYKVYFPETVDGIPTLAPKPMGDFYQSAATALIDYDSSSGGSVPTVTMPRAWDALPNGNSSSPVLNALIATLQKRSSQVATPMGRFQDSTRLYRIRIFLRIKGHSPNCPTELVWSKFSDPFRIAAWHESAGRATAPVPLPDPGDRNFLKNAKPNCSFTVPASLMNAMNGSTLSGLSSGSGPAGGGLQLNWICGFNIPLITICAFFVLNIFLTLLNIVFFWLPFIKICIPFPLPAPGNSGDTDGT